MILTCSLCGELQMEPRIPLEQIASIPAEHRKTVEYQAAMIAFAGHIANRHGDYAQLLNACAQTYLFHLTAKLATNAAPEFDSIRTEGRRLAYWTLAEQFDTGASTKGPIVAP